ncbi:MAG: hypothetical protein K2J06_02515, partial [Muribaculaceae bacterium]|nr:hypothetical protein [Muribaculaceae bacterium]
SPWYDRVGIVAADFTECKSLKADAIVSNPPFFTSGILASDPHRADARHEGSLSVDSLLDGAAEIMDQGGRLAVIIPFERLDKTVYSAAIRRLDACRIAELASNPASLPIRVMIEFTKGLADTFSRERIDIRSEAGSFSSRYAELTSEFYL